MTKVSWNKQALLAGSLLALGMAAYWLEYKHKPASEAKEEQNKKLFSLKDTQVKGVAIRDGAGHDYEIRCSDATSTLCKPGENSKWELAQPIKLKADDSNSNALVSALNNLQTTESVDLKDETPEKRAALLKEYGLDAATRALPVTRKIAVTTPAGVTTLYLGGTSPIGESIFGVLETAGKTDETKVYLVPTYIKANFDHDLTYWRDKKLLTASAHEIESFTLKTARGTVEGTRKDGKWTLKTGRDTDLPGDIENIDNLLTAATFMTAKGFASDDKRDAKAKAALAGTQQVVSLTMQQEKAAAAKEASAPIVLALVQKGSNKAGPKGAPATGKLYATVSNLDPVYELEITAVDRLNKELKDLRLAKLITSMERFTIKRIEISGKPVGEPMVLNDKDSKWVLDGAKAPIASEKVQTLLDKLSGNRIQEFISAAGGAAPAGESDGLTIKLLDDKAALKRQLVFWKSGGKLYARDPGSARKEAYRVDPMVQDGLPWARDFFEVKAAPVAPAAGLPPGHPTVPGGLPAGALPEPGKALVPAPVHSDKH